MCKQTDRARETLIRFARQRSSVATRDARPRLHRLHRRRRARRRRRPRARARCFRFLFHSTSIPVSTTRAHSFARPSPFALSDWITRDRRPTRARASPFALRHAHRAARARIETNERKSLQHSLSHARSPLDRAIDDRPPFADHRIRSFARAIESASSNMMRLARAASRARDASRRLAIARNTHHEISFASHDVHARDDANGSLDVRIGVVAKRIPRRARARRQSERRHRRHRDRARVCGASKGDRARGHRPRGPGGPGGGVVR